MQSDIPGMEHHTHYNDQYQKKTCTSALNMNGFVWSTSYSLLQNEPEVLSYNYSKKVQYFSWHWPLLKTMILWFEYFICFCSLLTQSIQYFSPFNQMWKLSLDFSNVWKIVRQTYFSLEDKASLDFQRGGYLLQPWINQCFSVLWVSPKIESLIWS